MNITNLSKSEVVAKLQSARGAIQRARAKAEKATETTVSILVSTAGGYGAGCLDSSKLAKIPNTEIDTSLALGLVSTFVGVSGFMGAQSDHLTNLGRGMLAGYAALYGAKNTPAFLR